MFFLKLKSFYSFLEFLLQIEKKMHTDNTKENLTSQRARGERLRRLRNMANVSREELCNIDTLNTTTYKGWEIGRFGGLTISGAKEVIKRVAKEGVICSLDWLLSGQGCGPFVIADTSCVLGTDNNNVDSILQEVTVFQNNFKNGIFIELLDDGMHSQYSKGDYVAGIKKYGREIISLIGETCIVETINNQILVRQILKGTANDTYTLVCTNPKTTVKPPVLLDLKINAAAPIIRHYKRHDLA